MISFHFSLVFFNHLALGVIISPVNNYFTFQITVHLSQILCQPVCSDDSLFTIIPTEIFSLVFFSTGTGKNIPVQPLDSNWIFFGL